MSFCRYVVVMLMWLWLLLEPCTCHISVEELLFYLLPGLGLCRERGVAGLPPLQTPSKAKQSKDRETETERARERERER